MAEDFAIAAGSGPSNGQIIARDLTPTMAAFRIALDTAAFPFEAGQYIAIGLELSRGLVQRPYSIASSARRLGDGYELYIREVSGGAFTPSLFATRVGQRLQVRRPKGRFVLGVDDQRIHLFVATGCGLAPFLAMLRTLLDEGRSRRVVLLHGVSHVAELGYRALLEDWERSGALPLRYLPTISRPGAQENSGWQGRTGRTEAQLPQVLVAGIRGLAQCGRRLGDPTDRGVSALGSGRVGLLVPALSDPLAAVRTDARQHREARL